MRRIRGNSLYLVVSEEYCLGRPPEEVARAAILGGVDILQLREKNKSGQELLRIGRDMLALCRKHDVTLIVNDDPLLAKRIGADGVHLGQEDMGRFSVEMARDTLGPDKIIGVSTHSVEQFAKSAGEDVNYIAFGPVFPTKTKDYCIGTDCIKKVMEIATKPVFFIGGIDLSNIDRIFAEGGENIALIRGITEADDISGMTGQFKKELSNRRKAAGG